MPINECSTLTSHKLAYWHLRQRFSASQSPAPPTHGGQTARLGAPRDLRTRRRYRLVLAGSDLPLITDCIHLASPPSGVHMGHLCLQLPHRGAGSPLLPISPAFPSNDPTGCYTGQSSPAKSAKRPTVCAAGARGHGAQDSGWGLG